MNAGGEGRGCLVPQRNWNKPLWVTEQISIELCDFLPGPCTVVTFLLLWRDAMSEPTYKREHLTGGFVYSLRGLVHYYHGGEHGTRTVAESYIVMQADRDTGPGGFQSPSPVTQFLQQRHTCSSKATPPLVLNFSNSATMIEHLNISDSGDHFYSNYLMIKHSNI